MSHSVVLFLLVFAPALAMVLALLGLETLEKNILGWLGLAMGVGYPSGAVIHFWLRKEPLWEIQPRKNLNVEERGDTSFWIILPGLVTIFFAPPLEYLYLQAYLPRADRMEVMGLALILLGAACYFWARAALKAGYAGCVNKTAGQQLVQNGPYRYLRHPGYTGYFLMALGFCLGYSSAIGLAAIPILMLPGFAYRMNVEEKLLVETFGNEYREYVQRTKRILPGIW
jgi:protein-S-isoprenylcysteine O-methyltransferase Ste14